MTKTALYQAMREQGVGRAELVRRRRWHPPQFIVCSTCVTLREWSMLSPRSRHLACV
jgi:hypothetical protein